MTEDMLQVLPITDTLTVPYVSEEAYGQVMTEVVEPALAALRTEKDLPVSGGTLHTESYVLPGAQRAVILLHGYTESAEKLRELAWYFVRAGFSVFSWDQRGHGRSLRHVDDESITHVEHFHDYVADAEAMLRELVEPGLHGAKLCLFGHSMGGAVSAHLLLAHPELFDRAVLSSPMIVPSSGSIPLPVATALTKALCLVGKAKDRAFIAGPFDPEKERFETSCTTSPARFAYYRDKRVAHRYLQNCSPTYGWTKEAVDQTKPLMKAEDEARITTPVLLCQASLDDVVMLPPQDAYIRLLPKGRLVRFEGAKHEIYNATDDVMRPYVRQVLRFMLGLDG